MRHINILVASLLLCVCSTMQAKDKVIEQPPYIARNTASIEVSKITISDTATVVHIYAKYRPKNWIRIAPQSYLKDNTGKKYQLRSGIGIVPGKEFWMPESGEAEFDLIFPTLPPSVTSVDFSESEDGEGDFRIWGIQLKSNQLPQQILPKGAVIHKIDKNTPLPEPVIEYGTATLKGKVLDYQPGMDKQLRLYLSDPIKGFGEGTEIDIQSDGSFTYHVPIASTMPVSIYFSETSANCFVEPGKTTELYINFREACRQSSKFFSKAQPYGERVYINGPLAAIAQEFYQNQKTIQSAIGLDYSEIINEISDMDVIAYKTYVLNKHTENQQKIDQLPLSQAAKKLLSLGMDITTSNELSKVAYTLTGAYVRKNKITDDKEYSTYYQKLNQSIPEDYLPINYLMAMNVPQAMLTPNYVNLFRTMVYDKRLVQKMGDVKGILPDMLKAAAIYKSISDLNPLSDDQKKEMASFPIAYQKTLEQANEQLVQLLEANKKKTRFTINQAGEVSNEDLFASIISKFKGKVILVDFWATWCGPCRMANKAMIPMKEELKGKDIVYLYITGETSPLKTWENMIPDIHGEHFRVTESQWKYLGTNFKIEGVPTYLIIDRDGNIKFKQVGFPGVEKIKSELMKVTN